MRSYDDDVDVHDVPGSAQTVVFESWIVGVAELQDSPLVPGPHQPAQPAQRHGGEVLASGQKDAAAHVQPDEVLFAEGEGEEVSLSDFYRFFRLYREKTRRFSCCCLLVLTVIDHVMCITTYECASIKPKCAGGELERPQRLL